MQCSIIAGKGKAEPFKDTLRQSEKGGERPRLMSQSHWGSFNTAQDDGHFDSLPMIEKWAQPANKQIQVYATNIMCNNSFFINKTH